jgi:hypothetical protein
MRRGCSIALAACLTVAAAGCGGGSERQDADEPSGTWTVDVVEAQFPKSQRLAERATMRIRVRNREDRAIPNVALTVEGFSRRSEQAGLADPERPIFIVDDGPRGGVTAYTNTWALGRVPPGATKTFEWKVTPVRAGTYRLTYRVAAGLDGKARARTRGGDPPEGTFTVRVRREPSQARVDPDSGEVVRE